MGKFKVKNPKGLFVELRWRGLVSVDAARRIKEIAQGLPESERASALKVVEALMALPVGCSRMHLCPSDPGFDPVKFKSYKAAKAKENRGERLAWGSRPHDFMQFGEVKAYGWAQIGTAKGASDDGTDCPGPKEAGWHDIAAFAPKADSINKLLAQADAPEISQYVLSGWTTAAKRAKELAFEAVEQEAQWACCEAWMIFGKTGYLDDKGWGGPLSRARMFESAASAARTAKAKRISGWKIVKAKIEAVSLEAIPGDTEDDRLGVAMSIQESKAIRSALEAAGIERLKAALEELQAKSGMDISAPVEKKRSRL